MLSVAIKPIIQCFMLSVIMLNVVTPTVIISAVASNDHGLSNMYSKMQVIEKSFTCNW
jgi:hypothetical protein